MKASGDSSTRPRGHFAAAVIVAAIVLAYVPAMRGGFVWDDDQHVVHDRSLQGLRGLGQIWVEPGATPQYYPLVHTTFWIENRLWGVHPFGYHLVNVLLHAAVALLFYDLLRKLKVPGAWLAGAIFALHPVHVESVAWVSERKNVLSGLFYLLAFRAYLRYAPPEEDSPRGGWIRAVPSLLFFFCALLSKTVTATLPVALLIVRWWKRGRLARRDVVPLLPFFAAGIALSGVTVWMERHNVGAEGPAWDLSPLQRVIIAGRALFFYLSKLIYPAKLAFIYPRWPMPPSPAALAYPAAACAAIAGLVLLRHRLGRAPLAAALFFAATLVPALGFFNFFPMRYSFVADHFQYLASCGPIALFGAFLSRLGRSVEARWVPLAGRGARAIAGTAILAALGMITWVHAGAFENAEVLWRDTIAKNPTSWMAQHNLGLVYEIEGHLDAALLQYRRAIAIDSTLEVSHYTLATALAKQGNLDEAQKEFEVALRIRPDYVDAWNNLGNVYQSRGNPAEAAIRYRRALACDAGFLPARKNLAYSLGEMGRAREAIAEYREAARLSGDDASILNSLARLLATAPDPADRDVAEAVRLSERACALTGNADASCLRTLSVAYQGAGRNAEAARAASRAQALGGSPSARPPAAR